MPLTEVMAKLEAALIQQPVQRMAARFDWARFRTAYPHLVRDARFIDLMSDEALARGSRKTGANLRSTLVELDPGKRPACLEQELTATLARILDAAPEKLDIEASIDILGLDSLMLTQLRNWMLRSLDINLPLIKLLKGPSIVTLAAELLGQLDTGSTAANGASKDSAQSLTTFTVADLDGVRVLNPWLIRGCGNADAPCRLICFHSMGVGASLFTKFLLNPPEDCDILAVQTPGRENRLAEPVAESLDWLVDQIVPELLPYLDRPVVIWGHSFGGIVAFEVIRRLRDHHQFEPAHFVVTGTVAPHLIHVWQHREVILKSMIADNSPEYMISLSRYVDDPEFLAAIMPFFRRDWPLLKNLRLQPIAPLGCPITAFAARQDEVAYTDEVGEWARHTDAAFELIEVDGDHWFLNRNRERIIGKLREIIAGTMNSKTLSQPLALEELGR
jgi:surfactin synthase thioesterase subunit/acyl carrier protein